MIGTSPFRSPSFLFLALGLCLLPLGCASFYADWPPFSWKHAHFADSDIGQTLIAISGLFFLFAAAYFIFPKLFRRRMNEKLGHVHFVANVFAVVLLLVLPVYFNLTLPVSPGESKSEKYFTAFGASMTSTVWEMGAIVAAQVLFLANVFWSLFKGEKIPTPQPR